MIPNGRERMSARSDAVGWESRGCRGAGTRPTDAARESASPAACWWHRARGARRSGGTVVLARSTVIDRTISTTWPGPAGLRPRSVRDVRRERRARFVGACNDRDGRPQTMWFRVPHEYNYPPASAFLFGLKVGHGGFSTRTRSPAPLPVEAAQQIGAPTITSQLAIRSQPVRPTWCPCLVRYSAGMGVAALVRAVRAASAPRSNSRRRRHAPGATGLPG